MKIKLIDNPKLPPWDRFGISGVGGSAARPPENGSDGNHDGMGDSK